MRSLERRAQEQRERDVKVFEWVCAVLESGDELRPEHVST